jgi:hypothetical protein
MRRLRELMRRGRATVLLEGAGALVVVAVLLLTPAGGQRGTARVDLSRAAGTLSLSNSREGAAVLQAPNLRPGDQASGSVRVTNTGTLGATLTLAASVATPADQPSLLLAARLQLTVLDVTDPARPAIVYSGPLATMPATSLGALGAGTGRDFRFVASLPAGTAQSDNPLQGATIAVGFAWTAAAASPGGTVTPAPTPAATPTPTPTPTATPTVTPPPVTSGTCAPRRVRIRIRAHGHRIRRVTVKVGRAHAKRVRPRTRITVTVKGSHAATVRVTATLDDGRRVVVRRRVRGC